jgi:hypothetical protein
MTPMAGLLSKMLWMVGGRCDDRPAASSSVNVYIVTCTTRTFIQ